MNLSHSQKRYLRGLGHPLHPVIMVGNKGVTEALFKELDLALLQHQLVKVKFSTEDRLLRKQQITTLGSMSNAELVHSVGKVACYFRQNTENPTLMLPK